MMKTNSDLANKSIEQILELSVDAHIRNVAKKLSCLPASTGKEKPHGDGPLPLREVRLEGLVAMIRSLGDGRQCLLTGLAID